MKKKRVFYYAYNAALKKSVKTKTVEAAKEIASDGACEYVVSCPKCACFFGV